MKQNKHGPHRTTMLLLPSPSVHEAAKAGGWAGVGFWQADGMWPYPYCSNITIYCKDEMGAMWEFVRDDSVDAVVVMDYLVVPVLC